MSSQNNLIRLIRGNNMKTDYRSLFLKLIGAYSKNFHITRKKIFKSNLDNQKEDMEEINYLDFLKKYIETLFENNNEKIVLSSTEFVITQKCTLNCEKCANLMPLYNKPKTFTFNELKRDLDAYMEVVDYVYELRLIGGEPFINKEIDTLIEYIFENYGERFAFITFTSNGTLELSEDILNSIKKYRNRIYITVSDYGKISHRIIPQLEHNNIHYKISTLDWIDYGPMESNNYSFKDLKKIFGHCSIKIDCNNLHDGKFHLCPRDAHGISLGILKHDMYLDLHSNISREEKKRKIRELYKLDCIQTCDYCKIYEKIPIERPYFD